MAETARENQVSSAAVKYETVADMGSGLVIAKVKLTDFREQDINARIMKTEMQKQLTDNIKKRGQLESLPFCALIDGKIEIISGHHRIRSAKDSGVLFKSGIMEALHQLGLCDAVYGKLYSYLFGWEPRGVVLHQVKYPSVQEVIATAKAAGAVLVFAHPTVYKSMPLVRQLAKEGIIDGIEVEHPRNSPEDRAECAALCEQYGLIHTGGTDFHGANHKVPHPVGTCTTADDQVARILELAHKRRGIDV